MDELASMNEELEDTMDVQDVEDLRELSESCTRDSPPSERHTQSREKRGFAVTTLLRQPLLTQLSVRGMPPSAALDAGKERENLNEGLSIRRSS